MPPIRSVLWIGSARGLEDSPVAGVPSVDLAWAPDLDAALELPLAAFDVVVMDAPSAPEDVADAARVRLARAGARDVLVTADPARFPALADLAAARRLTPLPKPEDGSGAPSASLPGVIGTSAAMREALALVARAQRTSATVLLTGETGTGKEVLARAVHAGSRRSGAAFVAVNCAAFPEPLLESELFGHVRGAFTGADRGKPGLFEAADGGSLFLDEVGETSLPLQAKLLRALQEGEVRAVGGTRARRVDVRVIAATNRELRREIAAGRFREDLYYRLAVFPVRVPPLRERRDDVLPLAEHFLALHGRREGKRGCRLTPEAVDLLRDHAWPGNVRELENEMQRALALSEPGNPIGPERLSERVARALEPVRELASEDGEPLRATMARIEAWLLRRALAAHGGRRAETARRLGLTREGLYKKLRRLGIE